VNKKNLKAWGGTALVVVIVLVAIGFAKKNSSVKKITDKAGI